MVVLPFYIDFLDAPGGFENDDCGSDGGADMFYDDGGFASEYAYVTILYITG